MSNKRKGNSKPLNEQPREEHDRQAQPVDKEEPPRLPFPVVGIGASAGGLEAFTDFFNVMPPDSGMAFVLVQHLPPDRESMVADILSKHTKMLVQQVEEGMTVQPNHVYIIRPGHTLTIYEGKLRLGAKLERPRHSRPVDDFFKSLAEEQRERAIVIIMSGMGSNGTAGAQAIKAVGGLCIAQDPGSAQFPSMPRHLIDAGYADFILRTQEIPDVLINYARHPYAKDRFDSERSFGREQNVLREILAIMRTRMRQDFTGYKKPTVLRRIQRRMGLNRITSVAEYAKFLRQSPAEVTALHDDFLIHVTGFFRDAGAWESLREKVIAPLVAARDNDAQVRCWVTACSSGEEAYTLGMVLIEECERANKTLDIKIFATDTADRTLVNARNGAYPGGIEAEMSPERLERFFQREDSIYRVRQDLRERVVFAPQNVLQDPPFSRLDIATCRNLLIYLEPDVQHRVLSMLHFGLRDGGALFLGTSETVGGAEDMFSPIDKKARIFRRIGATRHGVGDFTVPATTSRGDTLRAEARAGSRPSLAQLTARALLARFTPAAVTVDRARRILFYHGNTTPFLNQPVGEPTRDVLVLSNEHVRGAIRTVLQRTMASRETETVVDGWITTEHGRRRIAVSAAPLEIKEQPEFYIVSFHERDDPPHSVTASDATTPDAETANDLERMRDELQSTIEELQTSNEEHKASSEEVMSINEELQSSNEELETSREEMQSLNEELTTVNAQLQAKIEEHQTATNDLRALLGSTEIAVIFLDTQFRIRRFTTAAQKLLDLISGDIGRPMKDLARKFTDAELSTDLETVLAMLTPIEREVLAESNHWYLRRTLPYRTVDNRIDGVVITFTDITEMRVADLARRQSEARLQIELRRVNLLHESTQRVVAAPDIDSALEMILDGALRMVGTDVGDVQVLTTDGVLKFAATRGIDVQSLSQFAIVRPSDETSCSRALTTKRTVVIEDVKQDPAYARHLGAAERVGFRAVVSVPMLARSGEVLGIVSPHFRQPHQPTPEEMLSLEVFVQHATDVIERLRIEDEFKRLLRDEQAARRALDEGSRMKDEFIAALSHELRTPLSSIALWSKILRDHPRNAETTQEGLNAIAGSADAQARLIEDLLDTSRIAAGKLRLDMVSCNLAESIHSAVATVAPAAMAKSITLDVRFPADLGFVVADSARLRQVFWNLLSNAVKFTMPDGTVMVSGDRIDGEIEVRIADTGTGIDPTFLPFVFDRFRQYDPSASRMQGGLGLGLSIARQLVEMHGGSIHATSPGKGKGATFIVRLPVGAARPISAEKPKPAGTQTARLDNTTILLVEDESSTRNALAILLTHAGAKVLTAESASAAIDMYRGGSPSIIVSDIGLTGDDGYSLLRQIRALESASNVAPVPALALTAFAREEDRSMASAAGFQHHLAKPVDPTDLIENLAKLIAPRN